MGCIKISCISAICGDIDDIIIPVLLRLHVKITPHLEANRLAIFILLVHSYIKLMMMMLMMMTCTAHVSNTAAHVAWREFFNLFKINERKVKVQQKIIDSEIN